MKGSPEIIRPPKPPTRRERLMRILLDTWAESKKHEVYNEGEMIRFAAKKVIEIEEMFEKEDMG